MSEKLVNNFLGFRASQFVISNILVFEVNGDERPFQHSPSQYYRFNLFVFDMHSKRLFYYDDRCQRNDYMINSHKDELYTNRTIHDVFTLKRILHNYKRHLKPYFRKAKLD